MDVAYQTAFFGGLLIFFGSHYFTVFRKRDGTGIADRIGRGPYMGLYSLISIVGFVLMAWGFALLKDRVQLWAPPPWGRHVTMALMLPAIILIVAAYMPPVGFIKKAVRHPMLAAIKLWALAHVFANGGLYPTILFASFLIFGVVDRIAVKRRGDEGAAKANPNVLGDLLSIAVGIAVYLLLIYELHYMLFGVDVLAG